MISRNVKKKDRLAASAVGEEVLLHVVAVRFEHDIRAAKVPDLLIRAFDHTVALAALGVDHLAGAGDLEALFSARLGLKLGHFALSIGWAHDALMALRLYRLLTSEQSATAALYWPGGLKRRL
jgi:hypothetical protein